MFAGLEEIAPHLLGIFMIALACIPLVFVWQDRRQRRGEAARMQRPDRAPRARLAAWR